MRNRLNKNFRIDILVENEIIKEFIGILTIISVFAS